jgi:hypothetical protein
MISGSLSWNLEKGIRGFYKKPTYSFHGFCQRKNTPKNYFFLPSCILDKESLK